MPTTDELEERIAALEQEKIRLSDLPVPALQRKLELDWQPRADLLLQPGSVSADMLDAVYRQPIPLAAAWSNYSPGVSAGFEAAVYSRIGKLVVLQGLVTKTGAATPVAGDVIGTLPAGVRPPGNLLFSQVVTDAFGRINVNSDGNIVWSSGGATNPDYTSLNGISFVIA